MAVVVVGLLVALWSSATATATTAPTQGSTPPPSDEPAGHDVAPATKTSTKKKKKAKAKPKVARLTIVATGQVYVCLKAAGKRTRSPASSSPAARARGPYKSSRFRLQLGNGEARLIVNGKSRSVPSVANGIGYEITPRRVRRAARAPNGRAARRA